MYVGQSIDIDYRYRQHVNPPEDDYGNPRKRDWVMMLRLEGHKPGLAILETCDAPELGEAEKRHIEAFRANGEAELNIASGGTNRGNSRIKSSKLEEWHQLGIKAKTVRDLMHHLVMETQKVGGPGLAELVDKAAREFDKTLSKLDDKVCRVFPTVDHRTICGFFYGPPIAGWDDALNLMPREGSGGDKGTIIGG